MPRRSGRCRPNRRSCFDVVQPAKRSGVINEFVATARNPLGHACATSLPPIGLPLSCSPVRLSPVPRLLSPVSCPSRLSQQRRIKIPHRLPRHGCPILPILHEIHTASC